MFLVDFDYLRTLLLTIYKWISQCYVKGLVCCLLEKDNLKLTYSEKQVCFLQVMLIYRTNKLYRVC